MGKPQKLKSRYQTVTAPDGEKKQLKAYGRTIAEAKNKLALLVSKWEKEHSCPAGAITAIEYAERWIERTYARKKVGKSIEQKQLAKIKNHVAPVFGTLPLADITKAHCEEVFYRCTLTSHVQLASLHSLLRLIFSSAVDDDILLRSPMARVERPHGLSGKRRALTNAEQRALRDVIDRRITSDNERERVSAAFFSIMLDAGLRPGEVSALTWTCVNLTPGAESIRVTQAVKADSREIARPKSEAGIRTVIIPPRLAALLSAYKERSTKSLFLFSEEYIGNYLSLWTSLKKEVEETAEITLEGVVPYSLRHTCCTNWRSAGVELKVAQQMMGHSSSALTLDVYTDVSEDMIADARNKITGRTSADVICKISADL